MDQEEWLWQAHASRQRYGPKGLHELRIQTHLGNATRRGTDSHPVKVKRVMPLTLTVPSDDLAFRHLTVPRTLLALSGREDVPLSS